MTRAALGISEVSARTGLDQRVLRIWENRYGFPAPRRLENGRRAYEEDEVERLHEVVRLRDSGYSLQAAIGRARAGPAEPDPGSIIAGLRLRRPELAPHVMPKRMLTRLSQAIEDEYCVNAERGIVFGSFQRRKHYEAAESRWRDISRTASMSAVFADFERSRAPRGAPIEISISETDPLSREWTVVCDAPAYSACLLAWERPGQNGVADGERQFETIWSVEPEVTRSATRAALGLAMRLAPGLIPEATPELDLPARTSTPELKALTALTNRMLAYSKAA